MLKDMMIMRDPLKLIGQGTAESVKPGGFAAILARAGVGKTALLVQIAMNAMLKEKNVLHISTEDPVDKVSLWYQEVFQRLSQGYDAAQITKFRDKLFRHRFIMTFETESFSIAKLKKRVDELISQDIFIPSLIVIDGFSFEEAVIDQLQDLKSFTEKNDLILWFTVRTHREEPEDKTGLPVSFNPMAGLFDLMIRLLPEKDRIYLRKISPEGKAMATLTDHDLFLDPSTMLIKEKDD